MTPAARGESGASDPAGGGGAPVVLYGRSGCHLCAAARELVHAAASARGLAVDERTVDDDPELLRRFGDLVPVVLVDGVQVGFWRIDEGRLARALDRL